MNNTLEQTANSVSTTSSQPNWSAITDEFCAAWTSENGQPDLETLANFYAHDADVVIYDTLPPLEGFAGFNDLRSEIYDGLERIATKRTGEVRLKMLADGQVVAAAYPIHHSYRFSDGRSYEIDARITQVWEKRDNSYRIVQEHPSTVYSDS